MNQCSPESPGYMSNNQIIPSPYDHYQQPTSVGSSPGTPSSDHLTTSSSYICDVSTSNLHSSISSVQSHIAAPIDSMNTNICYRSNTGANSYINKTNSVMSHSSSIGSVDSGKDSMDSPIDESDSRSNPSSESHVPTDSSDDDTMTSEQPKLGMANMKKLFRKKRGLKRVKKVMKRKAEVKPIHRRRLLPQDGSSVTSRSSDDLMSCQQKRAAHHVIRTSHVGPTSLSGKQSDGNSSSGRTEHLNEVNSPLAPCLANNGPLKVGNGAVDPLFEETPEFLANIDRSGGPEGPPNITWRLTDALDKVRHYFDPAGPGYPPQNGIHFQQDQNDFLREQASLGGRNEQLPPPAPMRQAPQSATTAPVQHQQAPIPASFPNINTDFSNVASLSTNHPPPPYHINQPSANVPPQHISMNNQQQQYPPNNHGYPQQHHRYHGHPGGYPVGNYPPYQHPQYHNSQQKHPNYSGMPSNANRYPPPPPPHVYGNYSHPSPQPSLNDLQKRNCLNVNVYLP